MASNSLQSHLRFEIAGAARVVTNMPGMAKLVGHTKLSFHASLLRGLFGDGVALMG
jgi:hypothetical protein